MVPLGLGVMAGWNGEQARADATPQALPLVQDWSNPALLTVENDWSQVPGFVGYRGDKLAGKPGLNPQTITADGAGTPVNLLANQKNPNSLRTGGVAEFDGLANPTVAFKGSANAAAPMLVLHLDTTGKHNIAVGFKVRDVDGSANNAVQAVALQYRVQTNTPFTDLAEGYTADATSGPGLTTQEHSVVVVLPAEANNQPQVQVRWITANAEGNDEWVGIDDIAVIGDDLIVAAADKSEPSKAEPGARVAKPFRSPKDAAK